MGEDSATATYLIGEPFDEAVKLVRKALAEANLNITGELNLSGRIHKALLMKTAPCVVLFASLSQPDSQTAMTDPCEAALTPLHIVISARGSQTDVHLLKLPPRAALGQRQEIFAGLSELQSGVFQAIEKIGMRTRLGG